MVASVVLCVSLFELAALCGFDWRTRLLGRSEHFVGDSAMKPWRNPWNRRDPELLYLRPPHEKIDGTTPGDCVDLLGIATDVVHHYSLRFDANGFRNEQDVAHADVAVVGDSFVESALVPIEQVHTTLLAKELGVAVANFGVGGYAPQQEAVVLRRFALPLAPKVVLWVIFDGNDLSDVPRFERDMRDAAATEQQNHGFAQRSFVANAVRAVKLALKRPPTVDSAVARRASGTLTAAGPHHGERIYFPYEHQTMTPVDVASCEAIESMLGDGAKECDVARSRLVVVFAPEKFRVYRDLCEYPADGKGRTWTLNDFPERLAAWCAKNDVLWCDLTPTLQERARAGELVYFVDDGHWNERGNELVALALAKFVREKGLLAR